MLTITDGIKKKKNNLQSVILLQAVDFVIAPVFQSIYCFASYYKELKCRNLSVFPMAFIFGC